MPVGHSVTTERARTAWLSWSFLAAVLAAHAG